MTFIYLASPYSHPETSVRVARFIAARDMCVQLFHEKVSVFSPIVHWHNIAMLFDLPYEFEYWQAQNDPMIEACKELHVLMLDDWRGSKGVAHEVELADRLGKRVVYRAPK